MSGKKETPPSNLTDALRAIGFLTARELSKIFSFGQMSAVGAHGEIEHAHTREKNPIFYHHFFPLRRDLELLLAESYRRYFKLALAHPSHVVPDPHTWACAQVGAAVSETLEWIRSWYILACEGESECVQRIATLEFVPGQTASVAIPPTFATPPPASSWRAPAWLFGVSLPAFGIGKLKTEHVPNMESDDRLGEAHTRLLLKGARRVFLWNLVAAIDQVRNEEIAAAGAIPAPASAVQGPRAIKRKGWEQKQKLYSTIRKILEHNASLEGMQFCAELDKHHALPLFDWTNVGQWREGLTWKEAWTDPDLRRKIRRVRQEAMKSR